MSRLGHWRAEASIESTSNRDWEQEHKEAAKKLPPLPQEPSLVRVGLLPHRSQHGSQELQSAGSCISSKLVMEDPGSTDNFITQELARKLPLLSKATVMSVKVVAKQRKIKQISIY